ncbi:hypothetical protein VitviT2T_024787 [Vitis vinifera]|uniref:Acyl-CoA oxidase C-terminal domain-containing protein n=1 Tax=Vitis vinifera TaxID=29760 RepID=A0ABY9DIQ0_VITVI|nr:hypothetical protein VitviT2T_024787 [Vitis vinifera]
MNKSCPVVPSQLTSSTLRSSQFQTNIFCLRERDLLIHFAAEISQLQAHGLSREYALLQIFLDAEAAVSSGPLKSMLSLLRSMHVLIILEEDASFLRYGYLSPDNAAGISKKVTILYSELRPHALALVSSFGIPDAFLSPIAFNWIDANSWSPVQPQQGATVSL